MARRLTSIIDNAVRLYQSKGLGNLFVYYSKRLGLSRRAMARIRTLSRLLKIIVQPLEYLHRRQVAHLGRPSTAIPRDTAYLFLPPFTLPGTQSFVDYCNRLFEAKKEKLLAAYSPPYAVVLTAKTGPQGPVLDDPEDWRAVIEFLTQPEVIRIVADFMGEIPVLGSVSLMHTPVNSMVIGPQKFHRDINHHSCVHLVIAIRDIDEDCGPFTFIPADISRDLARRLGHYGGRVEDEEMFAVADRAALKRLTGPAGATFFLSPYRCFHFGARATRKPRLIFIANYTSVFEEAEPPFSVYRAVNRHLFCDGPPLRRQVLDLP